MQTEVLSFFTLGLLTFSIENFDVQCDAKSHIHIRDMTIDLQYKHISDDFSKVVVWLWKAERT